MRICPRHPNHFACLVSGPLGLCGLLGEQKSLVEIVDLLDVCEDLECTLRVLDSKLKCAGRTLQEVMCL